MQLSLYYMLTFMLRFTAVQYDKDNGFITWLNLIKKDKVKVPKEIYKLFEFSNSSKDHKDKLDEDNGINNLLEKNKIEDTKFKDWASSVDAESFTLDNYKKHLKETASSTSLFTNITQKAIPSIKSFGSALASIGVNMLISFAIKTALDIIDSISESLEEQTEALNQYQSQIQSYQGEMDAIEQKIVSNNQKIEEIEKNPLTAVDAKTLSTLELENEQLNRQLDTLKLLNKETEKLAQQKTMDILNNTATTTNVQELIDGLQNLDIIQIGDALYGENGVYGSFYSAAKNLTKGEIKDACNDLAIGFYSTVNPVVLLGKAIFPYTEDENDILEQTEEQLNKAMELRQKLNDLEANRGDYKEDKFNKKYDAITSKINKNTDSLVKNIITLKEYQNSLDVDDPEQNEKIKQIQSLIDKYTSTLVYSDDYNTFDKIITSDAYKDKQNELIDLAEEGSLTEEILNEKYHDLSVMFKELGFDIDDVIEKLKQMGNAFDPGTIIDSAKKMIDIGNSINPTALSKSLLEQNMQLQGSLSSLKSEYESVTAAINQYSQDGYLTADSLDAILSLSDQTLNKLRDENGQISLNSESWDQLTLSRLDEMKASVYQSTAMEIARITALDNTQAANELSLANGTLSLTAYEAAQAELAKARSMGGNYEKLANEKWQAAETRIGFINTEKEKIESKMISSSDLLRGRDIPESQSQKTSASKTTKQIDFIEYRLKELDNAINITEAHLNNFTGASAKNIAIDSLISINSQKQSDIEKSISLYKDMADELFNQIPAQYRGAAKDGAISITDFIETDSDSDKSVAETIEEYRSLADKVSDYENQLLELDETIKKLHTDKFNNIKNDYDIKLDAISSSTEKLEKISELQENINGTSSLSYYEEISRQTRIQLDCLKEERSALSAQMAEALKSGIKTGSEEWKGMYDSLTDIDSNIIDCTNSLEEFQNEINTLSWQPLEKLSEAVSHIDSETDFLLGRLEDSDVYSDGRWTDEAVTRLGLYASKYEENMYMSQQYKQAIDELENQYSQGKYNTAEYTEKLRQLQEEQWQYIEAAEAAKDAIIELNETKLDIQIEEAEKKYDNLAESIDKATEAYEEMINAKKEALSQQSEERSFKKQTDSLTEEISRIRKNIDSVNGNDSQEAASQKLQYEEELKEKQEELEELYYEHSIEAQQDAYDKALENYREQQENKKLSLEEELEAEREAFENSLKNREELLAIRFETAKENYITVYTSLAALGEEYNIKISDSLINSWKSGENALALYSETFGTYTSVFMEELEKLRLKIHENEMEAEGTYQQLINAFNADSQGLQEKLVILQEEMSNDTAAANIMKDSLINVFNPATYHISDFISEIQNVEGALDRANAKAHDFNIQIDKSQKNAENALEAANLAVELTRQTNDIILDTINKTKGCYIVAYKNSNVNFGIPFLTIGDAREHISSANEAIRDHLEIRKFLSFSKGGVIRHNSENTLEKSLPNGDDTIVLAKEGERILTPQQNKFFEELAKQAPVMLEKLKAQPHLPQFNKPDISSLNKYEEKHIIAPNLSIGSMVTVHGDIENTKTVKLINKEITKAVEKLQESAYRGYQRGTGGRVLR